MTHIPDELVNASIMKTIDGRVDKLESSLRECYSPSNFEIFRDKVTHICLEVIGADAGRTIIKNHAKEATKEHLSENNWEKLKIWVPVIVSVIAIVVSVSIALAN